MSQLLRPNAKVLILKDADDFWKHCNQTQLTHPTPDGPEAEAEERLDLRAALAIKALLEAEVGPEEGPSRVHLQNWDWNDDRCRGVYILKASFTAELIPKLLSLLTGEFADFRIILMLHEDWDSDAWGHLKLCANQIAVQQNVAQAYAIAV